MAAGYLASIASKCTSSELGKGLVGKTNVVELATNVEGAHVGVHVELVCHVGTVEDKVKGELVLVGPSLLRGDDNLLCAQLLCVLNLGGGVRHGVNLSTQSLGPLDTHMAETSDTKNCDDLAWANASSHERRVSGDTGAEKRSDLLALEGIGNLEGKVLVSTDVRSETTVSDTAIRVFAVVSVDHVRAVVFVLVVAELALEARRNLSTNTNTVANLDLADLVTNSYSLANNFVTNTERTLKVSPATSDGVDIRAADTAAFDLDINIAVSPGLGCKGLLLELVP
ncbi:hypothetical protein HG531_008257 [Fusarium graminearum]|nr:hypothetical protein HG531_008257 [Fusarium graminearum]